MKYLVFDVGGTAIKYALMEDENKILKKGERDTPKNSKEEFIEMLGSIYESNKDGIEGIAVSLPGRIDSERGYAHTGGSLVYNDNEYIADIISKKCDDLPVVIENDGKCAALAEANSGSLADTRDSIVMILGTGIGGGIIKDSGIHRGRDFVAGEFSFIVTGTLPDPKRPLKIFGFECGVPTGLCYPLAEKKGLSLDDINGRKFFEMLLSGDKDAEGILNTYCYNFGIQLLNLQHIYNPEKIAIGGGISAQDILMEYIEKNLEKVIEDMPLILSKPNVVRCRFGNDANLIGALVNFKDRIDHNIN